MSMLSARGVRLAEQGVPFGGDQLTGARGDRQLVVRVVDVAEQRAGEQLVDPAGLVAAGGLGGDHQVEQRLLRSERGAELQDGLPLRRHRRGHGVVDLGREAGRLGEGGDQGLVLLGDRGRRDVAVVQQAAELHVLVCERLHDGVELDEDAVDLGLVLLVHGGDGLQVADHRRQLREDGLDVTGTLERGLVELRQDLLLLRPGLGVEGIEDLVVGDILAGLGDRQGATVGNQRAGVAVADGQVHVLLAEQGLGPHRRIAIGVHRHRLGVGDLQRRHRLAGQGGVAGDVHHLADVDTADPDVSGGGKAVGIGEDRVHGVVRRQRVALADVQREELQHPDAEDDEREEDDAVAQGPRPGHPPDPPGVYEAHTSPGVDGA